MGSNRQKLLETNKNGKKYIETIGYRPKETETDRNKQNQHKRTETDRNRQKQTHTDRGGWKDIARRWDRHTDSAKVISGVVWCSDIVQ